MLEVFWANHTATLPSGSTQYASVAFYHDAEQEEAIRASIARLEAEKGKTIHTRVEPLERLYLAEDYHQKYSLRLSGPLLAEIQAIYPDDADLVNSTVAARLNGYLAGKGTAEVLERELESYGLSEAAAERLRQSVGLRAR